MCIKSSRQIVDGFGTAGAASGGYSATGGAAGFSFVQEVGLANPATPTGGTTPVGWIIMGLLFMLAIVFSGKSSSDKPPFLLLVTGPLRVQTRARVVAYVCTCPLAKSCACRGVPLPLPRRSLSHANDPNSAQLCLSSITVRGERRKQHH